MHSTSQNEKPAVVPASVRGARPSSPRKIASARANGARSRGPVTPEGKVRSARNALVHGLTAATIVLGNEDPAQYESLRAAYLAWFQPRNTIEVDLIDEMASAKWRHRRALSIESAALDLEMDAQREQVARDFEEISEDVRMALAFDAKARDARTLPILDRYEGRLSRQYTRALRMLIQVRANETLLSGPGPTVKASPAGPSSSQATAAPGALRSGNLNRPNEPNPVSEHALGGDHPRFRRRIAQAPDDLVEPQHALSTSSVGFDSGAD